MAAARFGRWLARGIGLALLAGMVVLGLRIRHNSQPAVWTVAEAASPNGQIIAAVKTESDWGYAKDFVSLRRAGDRDGSAPMVLVEYQAARKLLLRWRSGRDLDIGVPAWSMPDVRAIEEDGVRLRLVPYPDQPAVHEKFQQLQRLSPFRVGEMIEFERSRSLIDDLEQAAAYRMKAGSIAYKVVGSAEQKDGHLCSLGFTADGGAVAREIGFSLQARVDDKNIDKRRFADFRLMLEVRDVRDRDLSRLTATGAQLIGVDFATSMAESGRDYAAGLPESGGSFTIPLSRHRADPDGVIDTLTHAPYKLAFLWDLPDTVAVYEVDASPTAPDTASFLDCVGKWEQRPAFELGSEK